MSTTPKKRTNEESETARLVNDLRAAGLSYHQIGEGIGVNWRTILRWSRGQNQPWSTIAVNQVLAGMLPEKPSDNPSV